MQIKTIQKTIQNKMNEWLETIADVELKKSLKDNILVLEEQLIGVDVAYFSKLIEILRGIDNADRKITSGYLNEIIDRVFNSAEETE